MYFILEFPNPIFGPEPENKLNINPRHLRRLRSLQKHGVVKSEKRLLTFSSRKSNRFGSHLSMLKMSLNGAII